MIEDTTVCLDTNYITFLEDMIARLKSAQIRAAWTVNKELIRFYWELGYELSVKQYTFKWGSNVLEQFSHDMRQAFPKMQGFSVSNLKRMRVFAQTYPNFKISPQLVDQLPWGHIAILIQQLKTNEERDWYAKQTLENGWSRNILEIQIKSDLYARQGRPANKLNNFDKILPQAMSDLARELQKDPYHFDFLGIGQEAHEREIENAMITHIRNFLLELGQGFAFVGSQVPLTFDDQEFFIDLLFWHLELRCFCVVELKATDFKPEHTGQLGFYLVAVDRQLCKPGDNKTIGILLCKSKNKIVAEYALQSSNVAIGISEYQLTKAIPENLKTKLPSIQEIEAELNNM